MTMLFTNCLLVPDAMLFLDAFAEAAEKTRGWKLESIKFDYGYQFVYVRYTGRKFAGKGLMASAFAPVHQYRDCKGAVLAPVDAPLIRLPSRRSAETGASPIPRLHSSHDSHKSHPGFTVRSNQRINITFRADEWPTHVCFDQSAEQLFSPLLKAAYKATQPAIKLSRTGWPGTPCGPSSAVSKKGP